MSKLNVTELDFNQIKANLKTFLNGQDQFRDYNFEGSNLSILIDLLAANTAYNGFYGNMAANEMFLDSAILRNSVVSRAKALGYTPHSIGSAAAYVQLTMSLTTTPGSTNSLPYTIPKYTTFTSTIDSVEYTFSTNDTIVLQDFTQNASAYVTDNIKIVEGDIMTYEWTQNDADPVKFIIPNFNVDTNTLYVEVQNSVGDTNKNIYYRVTDLNVLTPDSLVYFLQETDDGKFEIYFGDGVLGKKLENGNIIKISYLISNGTAANGANVFSCDADFLTSLTTVYAAANGIDAESIESIKYYAPKTFEAQNRAVTKQDYQTLALTESPNLHSVRVWGGEEEEPPLYGFVIVCPKPIYGEILTPTAKQELTENILEKRSVVGVRVKIVDPEYLKLIINSEVHYDSTKTNYSQGQLKTSVVESIKSFSANSLSDFDAPFRYSNLCKTIDSVDDSILNNETKIKLKVSLQPTTGSSKDYTIKFNNAIDRGDIANNEPTLTSSLFVKNGITLRFQDDGLGTIKSYQITNVTTSHIYQNNAGTIDYDTGEIVLSAFASDSFSGSSFDLVVTPERNDIVSIRNQIIIIEDADITVTMVDENLGQ